MNKMGLAIGIMAVIVIMSLVFVISPPSEIASSASQGIGERVQTQDVVESTMSGIEKPRGTISVYELLNEYGFNQEVQLYGKVSTFGMLLCPCFELSSEGETVQVWYDLMDGQSAVSMEGIKNGDWVVVRGEYKESKQFWAKEITKQDKYDVEFTSLEACQTACVNYGYETGDGLWPSEAEPYFVLIGDLKIEQSKHCGNDGQCYCYCHSIPIAPETPDTSSSH
ncbi:MAG: hypothetical protein JXA43_01020 [Candidatus Diapherotrites archaeon]|nr:hypothetical protein [Candidatus Diapherotrites archaeon]